MGAAGRRGRLRRSGHRRRNLLRFALSGVVRRCISVRLASELRTTLAPGLWPRVAARFANAAKVLWKLLGRAVHRTHDRLRPRPSRHTQSPGPTGRRRSGLYRSEKETRAQRAEAMIERKINAGRYLEK